MMTSMDLSVDDMIYSLRSERGSDGLGAVILENFEAEAITRQLESAKELYRLVRTMKNATNIPQIRAFLHNYETAGRFRYDSGPS